MGQSYILKVVASVILFLLASGVCSAQSMESFNTEFHIAYGKVVVNEEMIFKTPISGQVPIVLPADAQGISVKVGEQFINSNLLKERQIIDVASAKTILVSYVTKDLLDSSDFLVSMKMPYDAEKFNAKVTLPEGATFRTAVSESDIKPSSVYPKPTEMTTDGTSILIGWDYEGLKKGDEKSFLVMFNERSTFPYLWVIIILLLVIAALLFFVFSRKRARKSGKTRKKASGRALQTKPVKEEAKKEELPQEASFEKHLKEDEEQVVNILKQREGECEQGTLRVITGFSKAKLSGLLKELEDRNIVYKEKRGKKNRVFLREL